jgi:hypothetical protein
MKTPTSDWGSFPCSFQKLFCFHFVFLGGAASPGGDQEGLWTPVHNISSPGFDFTSILAAGAGLLV